MHKDISKHIRSTKLNRYERDKVMTQQTQTQIETNKLFNDVLSIERKASNIGVKLAIAMFNAINIGEVDKEQVKAFGKGTSKKRAGNILNQLASFYSDTYAQALDDYQNKENSKEIRTLADKQLRSIKKAMTRALFIAGYAYERGVQGVNMNKQGDIVLVISEDEQETYSWTVAIKLAKKHYDRTGKGLGREEHSTNDTSAMPLLTAAKVIEDQAIRLNVNELAPATRKQLQAALIALSGMFAADDSGKLNVVEIERLYNEAA